MKLRETLFDVVVGIPGGLLIFMGMLMFNTLLSMLIPTGQGIMLFILCVTSLVVGMIARLMRPIHGFGTALAAGVVAALILLYLRLASTAGAMGPVFGPVGMLVAVGFSLLGAWTYSYFRQPSK